MPHGIQPYIHVQVRIVLRPDGVSLQELPRRRCVSPVLPRIAVGGVLQACATGSVDDQGRGVGGEYQSALLKGAAHVGNDWIRNVPTKYLIVHIKWPQGAICLHEF